MNTWMKEFISQCLTCVPSSAYRRRLEQELEDHLSALACFLEKEGLSSSQAQASALEHMGDPRSLSAAYLDQWRRHICTPRYVLKQLGAGCLVMGLAYLGILLTLGLTGITYDAAPGLSLAGSPLLTAGMGCLLFLLPFSLGAVSLKQRFRGHPRPGVMILAGLLLAWLGEKLAICSLSALIYGIPLWELGPLLKRIGGSGDPTAPWFTPAYLLLTLVGCLPLALLPSRPTAHHP